MDVISSMQLRKQLKNNNRQELMAVGRIMMGKIVNWFL